MGAASRGWCRSALDQRSNRCGIQGRLHSFDLALNATVKVALGRYYSIFTTGVECSLHFLFHMATKNVHFIHFAVIEVAHSQ